MQRSDQPNDPLTTPYPHTQQHHVFVAHCLLNLVVCTYGGICVCNNYMTIVAWVLYWVVAVGIAIIVVVVIFGFTMKTNTHASAHVKEWCVLVFIITASCCTCFFVSFLHRLPLHLLCYYTHINVVIIIVMVYRSFLPLFFLLLLIVKLYSHTQTNKSYTELHSYITNKNKNMTLTAAVNVEIQRQSTAYWYITKTQWVCVSRECILEVGNISIYKHK